MSKNVSIVHNYDLKTHQQYKTKPLTCSKIPDLEVVDVFEIQIYALKEHSCGITEVFGDPLSGDIDSFSDPSISSFSEILAF